MSPSSLPGIFVSALTKEVIHGSDRLHPAHRIDRALVSSIPKTRVGSGSGNHRAARAIGARWAVAHLTPYSPATSLTARIPDVIAEPIFFRSRVVSLARAGTATDSG